MYITWEPLEGPLNNPSHSGGVGHQTAQESHFHGWLGKVFMHVREKVYPFIRKRDVLGLQKYVRRKILN